MIIAKAVSMLINAHKRIILFVLLACLAAVVAPDPSVFGQSVPMILPGNPVPLVVDPEYLPYRVGVRERGIRTMGVTSTITVSYVPNGNNNSFGDSCISWPAGSQTAFDYAAAIWQGYLVSPVPIVIEACWTTLGPGILGHGGASYTALGPPSTFYPFALADAILGYDATGVPDITVAFSDNFPWYFGTDGNPLPNTMDFVSVVLHEIGHGLGFAGTMQGNVPGTGQARWGWGSSIPAAYDRFAVNNIDQSLINTSIFANPSASLFSQLTGGNVYFKGDNAVFANGGSNVKLYAPATWSNGSSYAHLDYNTYKLPNPNALMVYAMSYDSSVHDPGPVTLGILKDIGWSIDSGCTYSLGSSSNSFDLNGGTGSVSVTASTGCGWTAVSNDAGWLHVTSGTPGTGNGTVGYSVDQYTGTGTRTGTITIAGQTFTVTQTGCSYTLTPGSQSLDYNGGTLTFDVTTSGVCPWSASGYPAWVSIDLNGSGPGSKTVTYTVAANGAVASRSGNINIADKSFMITQTGVLPTADFSGSPRSGVAAPFQVTFTDLSSNASGWAWSFGDTKTSTSQNPVHTYKTAGTYDVQLTASNINGSSPVTKNGYIVADACGNSPVRRAGGGPDRTLIQAAYDDIGIGGTDTISVQAVDLTQPLLFDDDKTVTLIGGNTCAYDAIIPETMIIGSLTIVHGTVTIDGIVAVK